MEVLTGNKKINYKSYLIVHLAWLGLDSSFNWTPYTTLTTTASAKFSQQCQIKVAEKD